jgi:hypothetical protein
MKPTQQVRRDDSTIRVRARKGRTRHGASYYAERTFGMDTRGLLHGVTSDVTATNRPGGNATGMTLITGPLGQKRLEIVRELIPQVK